MNTVDPNDPLVAALAQAREAHKVTTRAMLSYERLPNLLIADHIKATPEFQRDRAAHDATFKEIWRLRDLIAARQKTSGFLTGG